MLFNNWLQSMFSKEYLEWVKGCNLPPLTNSQCMFAEFLLQNWDVVGRIGGYEDVFVSVRRFIQDNPGMFSNREK